MVPLQNTSEEKVGQFLREFKEKMKVWGVLFLDDRGKNFEALTQLDIRPMDREQILEALIVEDYSEGPKPEEIHGTKEMWVFGKIVKGQEIYIKITKGIIGSKVLCISFHLAERKIKYPFK
ncbi:hypothetical protein GCM10008106_01530 [Mongoliitalea lutea]|uniref:Toxin n=1 Tax=Mongoliitalea lutea TaxID=849756 RepID=A0A8J3G3M9_9BACT|nr:hypothetical protein GCM10008106_01530 [Mongoliitalea lutea]